MEPLLLHSSHHLFVVGIFIIFVVGIFIIFPPQSFFEGILNNFLFT